MHQQSRKHLEYAKWYAQSGDMTKAKKHWERANELQGFGLSWPTWLKFTRPTWLKSNKHESAHKRTDKSTDTSTHKSIHTKSADSHELHDCEVQLAERTEKYNQKYKETTGLEKDLETKLKGLEEEQQKVVRQLKDVNFENIKLRRKKRAMKNLLTDEFDKLAAELKEIKKNENETYRRLGEEKSRQEESLLNQIPSLVQLVTNTSTRFGEENRLSECYEKLKEMDQKEVELQSKIWKLDSLKDKIQSVESKVKEYKKNIQEVAKEMSARKVQHSAEMKQYRAKIERAKQEISEHKRRIDAKERENTMIAQRSDDVKQIKDDLAKMKVPTSSAISLRHFA